MHYNQRLKVAALVSLTIHLLIFYQFSNINHDNWPADILRDDPIVLNLQPEPDVQFRSLVDPSFETPPPDETQNIAEFDARAADIQLQEGEQEGPLVSDEADRNMTALPNMSPTPPQSSLPQVVQDYSDPPVENAQDTIHETTPESEIDSTPEPLERPQDLPSLVREEAPAVTTPPLPEIPETASPSPSPASEPDVTQEPEPEIAVEQPETIMLPDSFQMAQAMPVPENPQSGNSRGRLDNAVRNEGFTNFDAIQDQLAPYLREIRRRVERRWNEALLTRYSGTSPTVAVVDCAIAPDGTLVQVNIIGEPRDRVYAALCMEAIQRAAPFSPFPFEVPDIYRGQNLEIRWTFNFL